MRTLEHVLSSRSAHPTQRDPLNFIAPSPSPYASFSPQQICIRPKRDHTRGMGTPPLPSPSGKRKWPQRDKLPDDWRPPPLRRLNERGFERDKLSSFRSCLDSLISTAGITESPLLRRRKKIRGEAKGEGRRGRGKNRPLGKRHEHE